MPADPAPQRELFASRPAWEEDDAREGMIATVVLPEGVDKPLDYLVPSHLAASVEPGRRVQVPLGRGNRLRLAYCVAVRTGELPQHPLKQVAAVEDDKPLLSPRMLELTAWMAERWLARRGEVLEAVLPAGVRLKRRVKRVPVLVATGLTPARRPTPAQQKVLEVAAKPIPLDDLLKRAEANRGVINRLLKGGLLAEIGRAHV